MSLYVRVLVSDSHSKIEKSGIATGCLKALILKTIQIQRKGLIS